MNKVFLSGNLTRDIEIRYTQNGTAFARMGIAVNRRSKDRDAVDFFNLVAWDKTAEFCNRYMTKGTRVLVEGRLQTSSYEAQDGSKRVSTDVVIDSIEFGGSRRSIENDNTNIKDSEMENSTAQRKSDEINNDSLDPDDTPF